MRVVGLISGGKDSCYNMLECVRAGHEMVALAHLYPPGGAEMDSFMYQTVGSEAVALYAEAMGLPLFTRPIVGASADTGSADHYTPSGEADEVEDLHSLLAEVKASVPSLEAMSVGAILSNYQRVRVESVCDRLGLEVLAFLWRRDQTELLDEMLSGGLDAILLKVAAYGLTPARHLGQRLADVRDDLVALAASPAGLNACGEGGEYETLTLDCPALFRRGRILAGPDSRTVVVHSDDAFAPVCYLRLSGCRLEPRTEVEAAAAATALKPIDRISREAIRREFAASDSERSPALPPMPPPPRPQSAEEIPPLSVVNAWVGPGECDGDSTLAAAKLLMSRAADALESAAGRDGARLRPLLCVLQVPDMSAFAAVNAVYAGCFAPSSAVGAAASPPARACVETRPSSAAQMSLSILTVPAVAAAAAAASEVQSMRVRSRSHWAPANIGPYSQCCCYCLPAGSACPGRRLVIVSGQIGMDPATLEVPPGSGPLWQAELGLRHVARVAQANGLGDGTLASAVRGGRLCAVCFAVDAEAAAAGLEAFHRLACRQAGDAADCRSCRRAVVPALCSGLPKAARVEWLTFLTVGGDGVDAAGDKDGCGVEYATDADEIPALTAAALPRSMVVLCLVNETLTASAPALQPPPGVLWIRCGGFPGRTEAAAAVAWLRLR